MSNSNPTDTDGPSDANGTPDLTKRRTIAAVLAVIALLAVAVLTWWIDGRGGPDSESTAASSSMSPSLAAPADISTPKPTRPAKTNRSANKSQPANKPPAPNKQVPARVLSTLALVDAGRWPEAANAPGTHGGDSFRNNERKLPTKDSSGRRITYREWDVNPKQPRRGRDAERIVTSSDGSAWYTSDHYKSFILIRGPAA